MCPAHVSFWGGFAVYLRSTCPDVSAHNSKPGEDMILTQSLFQVEIYSDHDYFHIFIDEHKILQYKHRQKQLSSITKLQILNDITISSVEITKRGLY